MAEKKITVYALSTCPWCRKAKQFFKDHAIAAEEIDFDLCDSQKQQEALAVMKKHGGGDSFPFVLIGSDPVEGFDPERYCVLLGIQL
ncbi:MAG TPA: glutaredoxin family protein [Candidatus Omnitrophota bacterium]|nr:glutaredoxin family protein [Candidatus Omnitrophota bacterium]HNQ51097.1 glutaredoxin family protein [Candidatus Omnitrophota bacterium]HQO37560.1 glutaredoxin family protein [Candidatus Omnitrophota bacterium]HQQ05480.1 glutaredoxin family protein [Candidatus Omnitrophota bacterium]